MTVSHATPLRSMRIPDDLWDTALAIAAIRDENVSALVREYLESYVDDNADLLDVTHDRA